MIITKKIKRRVNCFLMISVLVMSCNSTKNISKEKKASTNECYIANEISSSLPENSNSKDNNILEEFKNSKHEFQVLWQSTIQNYDYEEKYVLFYLDNNKLFIRDNLGERPVNSLKLETFKDQLHKIRKSSFILNCQENTSSQSFNVFYFKENGNIDYTYNFRVKKLDAVSENSLSNEIEFVRSLKEASRDGQSN